MFKKNQHHFQLPLTSHVDDLPEKLRRRLENSWAGVFYREVFCRLDEGPFAVLYAEGPSRPNTPVNVLVGLEMLKAGHGWTDEELYDNFCYDVQVRYALGYRHLGEGEFEIRTLYYFRERLSRHMQAKGVNLLDQAFEQVTDAQLAAYQLKTGKQRMDSFQIASNIRQMGRVQLLVTVLQRVHRMLHEADQQAYAEDFAPYLKGHAGQYVYRLKSEDVAPHLQRIGDLMQRLLTALPPTYAAEPGYQVLGRVFGEHFRLAEARVTVKANPELSAASLQAPDDLEATYREKRGQGYQGYAANVTETCDPDNALQLITKIQVDSNTTDDSQFLAEALPSLKARTALETVYTDGGHGGPHADQVLAEQGVEQLQSAIRGRSPNAEKLHLADFVLTGNAAGIPGQLTCPGGQTVLVSLSRQQKAFVAHFAQEGCAACPLAHKCPAQPGKRDPRPRLRFTQAEAQAAQRRRRSQQLRQERGNLRAAVEATVRSVKHRYPDAQLPVRGKFRVTCLLLGAAAVANVRRIQRYLRAKMPPEKAENAPTTAQKTGFETQTPAFWAAFLGWFRGLCSSVKLAQTFFGC